MQIFVLFSYIFISHVFEFYTEAPTPRLVITSIPNVVSSPALFSIAPTSVIAIATDNNTTSNIPLPESNTFSLFSSTNDIHSFSIVQSPPPIVVHKTTTTTSFQDNEKIVQNINQQGAYETCENPNSREVGVPLGSLISNMISIDNNIGNVYPALPNRLPTSENGTDLHVPSSPGASI